MTTIYAKHLDPNLQKIIVENAPKFAQEQAQWHR